MKSLIITTYFSYQFAIAQLHAVMLDLSFSGRVIENHSVSSFSIIEGAFQISLLESSGTLELAVNLGNAQKIFGINVGEIIDIKNKL